MTASPTVASGGTTSAENLTGDRPLAPARERLDWLRVVNRRAASQELDRILGCPSRPNLAATYGLTS